MSSLFLNTHQMILRFHNVWPTCKTATPGEINKFRLPLFINHSLYYYFDITITY